MKNIFLLPLLLSISIIIAQSTDSEIVRPVLTGAPFLRVSPDARAGGIGDQGVSTSSDAFSQYWNAAKYVYSPDYSGIAVSYTPFLSNLTNDVFLLNATYHQYLNDEQRSSIAASIYYFNLGEINLTSLDDVANIINIGTAKPNEFAIDASYGLKLTDNYSMSVTGRYIRSDLYNNVGNNSYNTKAASSFAADIAGYYNSKKFSSFGGSEGRFRGGFQISNIGGKLDYSDSQENASFLPTNLRLGFGYDWIMKETSSLSLNLEFAKLLVPTPQPVYDANGNVTSYKTPDVSVISGMFESFGDAPDGGSEELKEITYSIGTEYNYNDIFMLRVGYFHESPEKGARQYMTVGTGLKYSDFGLDISYLITTSNVNSALDNTLRFALTWNFGGKVDATAE